MHQCVDDLQTEVVDLKESMMQEEAISSPIKPVQKEKGNRNELDAKPLIAS
jgi:hypothetical protein